MHAGACTATYSYDPNQHILKSSSISILFFRSKFRKMCQSTLQGVAFALEEASGWKGRGMCMLEEGVSFT